MKCSTISCINSQVLRKSCYYLFYRRYHVNFVILPGFHQVRNFQRLLRDEEISLWSCQSSWGLFEAILGGKTLPGSRRFPRKERKESQRGTNRNTRIWSEWLVKSFHSLGYFLVVLISLIKNCKYVSLPSLIPPSDRLNTFSSILVH